MCGYGLTVLNVVVVVEDVSLWWLGEVRVLTNCIPAVHFESPEKLQQNHNVRVKTLRWRGEGEIYE